MYCYYRQVKIRLASIGQIYHAVIVENYGRVSIDDMPTLANL
jgi:hypothetical protein